MWLRESVIWEVSLGVPTVHKTTGNIKTHVTLSLSCLSREPTKSRKLNILRRWFRNPPALSSSWTSLAFTRDFRESRGLILLIFTFQGLNTEFSAQSFPSKSRLLHFFLFWIFLIIIFSATHVVSSMYRLGFHYVSYVDLLYLPTYYTVSRYASVSVNEIPRTWMPKDYAQLIHSDCWLMIVDIVYWSAAY